ncbi:OmpA family protein [Shewanella sp. M-Br]|uniref:OmpA family protein n=1 Tax=Shewanella sp. M-Br TaxID=2495595 RepID=UPI002949AEC4|nr:flagellar motor protein MotB [Shewanella sp. M-Br]
MRKKKVDPPENHERWLISYADFMTLLFALFVVLYSFAMSDKNEAKFMVEGLIDSLAKIGLISTPAVTSLAPGGTSILEPNTVTSVVDAEPKLIELATTAPASSESNDTIKKYKEIISAKLKNEIENQEIEIDAVSDSLIIRIGDNNTFFASGSAFIQPKFVPLIDKIGEIIASVPGRIVIAGHTDATLPMEIYADNWDLSSLRATAVVRVITKNKGVNSSRIIVQGLADTQPRFKNDTPEHRQKNRRIEIIINQGNTIESHIPIPE